MPPVAAGGPQGPNLVLVLADDMGYGDFGCFNGGRSQTPTLDQLVADGVCLSQHCGDGRWKLVRPSLPEAMEVAPMDLLLDVDLRTNPGVRTEILGDPEPARTLGDPLPPQLYDLDADPGEEHDLAAVHPGRVSRMDDELARWFEDVTSGR